MQGANHLSVTFDGQVRYTELIVQTPQKISALTQARALHLSSWIRSARYEVQ